MTESITPLELVARGVIVILAIFFTLTDGHRMLGFAADILQGSDQNPGTTWFSLRSIKFWLAVVLSVVLPIAAFFMFAPLRYARSAALVVALVAGAWWLSVMSHEIYNEIDRGRGFPSVRFILTRVVVLGVMSVFPAAFAYWILRKTNRLSW